MSDDLFQFEDISFRYDPFPIAAIRNIFTQEIYGKMLEAWPEVDQFLFMPKLGNKYSLSEHNNSQAYHRLIKSSKIWTQVYEVTKSEAFIYKILDLLTNHKVDLGLRNRCYIINQRGIHLSKRLQGMIRGLMLRGSSGIPLKSRFEFSMLPGFGGSLRPHTDAPQKLITLVIGMGKPGEWKPEYGGGTSIMRPKDMTRNYNFKNEMWEFDETEEIHLYDFVPNQCVLFIKTFNSFHAVLPTVATEKGLFRKSLTINIETPKL